MNTKNTTNNNNSKIYSKRKKLIFGILTISCLFATLSFLTLYNWNKDNIETETINNEIEKSIDIYETLDNENTEIINPPAETQPEYSKNYYWDFIKLPLINVDFTKLLKTNKDTVGWISVNNTNINYPVVQTNNNSDYMDTAYDGSKNQAGWIFADYRNNMVDFDKNTIIYGHSRLNQTMFGSLLKVVNKSWYSNKYNHIIKFSTPYENTMWQVFSVYKIEPETYYLTVDFNNNVSYINFLDTIKARSKYNFNVELTDSDKIITLSTCSDAAGTGRIVLHAKLIKRETRN